MNLLGNHFYNYLLAGIFVGVAWNLILISTTNLLPHTYEAHERAKVQGMTDFLIYFFGGIGSLEQGFFLHIRLADDEYPICRHISHNFN